jgi:hypothetical protein
MNANQYSIRKHRSQRLFAAGAAALASTLVLSSVLWLFVGGTPVASAHAATAIQQLAGGRA